MIVLISILIIIGAIVVIGAIATVIFLYWGMSTVKAYNITNIDLSKISDGEYIGEHKKGRFSTKVKLTIKSHKIQKIDVLKSMVQNNGDIDRAMTNAILNAQSLKINTVSGATVSTKAFLKACENALTKK